MTALRLVLVDLQLLLREPGQLALLVVLVLVSTFRPGGGDAVPEAPAVPPPCEGVPPVVLEGDLPSWLAWPGPVVTEMASASARIRFDGDRIDLTGPGGGRGPDSVARCVASRLTAEQGRRLDRVGVGGRPGEVVQVDLELRKRGGAGLPGRAAWPPALAAGSFLAWVIVGDTLAGRRRRGVLEGWLTTRVTSISLVTAAFASAWLVAAAGMALGLVVGGAPAGWMHMAPGLTLMTAISVRVFATAGPDSGTLRPLLVVAPLEAVLGVLGLLLAPVAPALAAVVPVGGTVAAVAGALPAGSAVLSDAAAVAWAGLLLAWSAGVLRTSELVPSSLGATAARRARGVWWPELLVLGVIGAAGVSIAWIGVSYPPRWPVARVAIPLVLGVGPALLAPVVLARPDLLPRTRPGLRGALGAALVGLGVAGAWALVPALGGPLGLGGVDVAEVGAHLATDPWLAVLCAALACGLAEELLFRGVVFGLVGDRWPLRAYGIQALLYGLSPLLGFLMPSALLSALLLGALRWRTGSVAACVGAAVVGRVVLAIAAHQAGGWPGASLAAVLVGVGVVGVMVSRALPRTPRSRVAD